MKYLMIPFLFIFIFSACGTESEPEIEPPAPQPQPQPEPVDDTSASYTVTLTLSDSSKEIVLRFGQLANPSSQDEQMPPAPPEGNLHAYFTKENKDYWSDFRSEESEAEEWDFTFQTGVNGPVTLEWSLQTSKFPGTLTLVNPADDSSIEMEETGEIELPISSSGSLLIEYQLDE